MLALVSKPSYDPNEFAGGVSAATWKALTTDTWRPLQDRAISGQYPPGSTYKAIVAAAALQERVITTGGLVYCPGHFTLGRRTYRCWKKEGHGAMSLRDALVQSCDVYFYQAGLKLGIDRLAFFARGFSLGRRTGIRAGGRAVRPGADGGLEADALRRAVGGGGDGLGVDRAGLQSGHAAAARGRLRGDRQRRARGAAAPDA